MEYVFIEDVPEEEHDVFVANHPHANLLQSSCWGKVKEHWKHSIVGVKKDDHLVASAMILIKPLPLHYTLFYIPRGPIMDYENERLVAFMMKALKKYAKQFHCLFIIFDPAVECRIYAMQEQATIPCNAQSARMIAILKECGVRFHGFTQEMDATIQPRFHAVVHAQEHFDETLLRHCRKALHLTEKKMIEVEIYHEDGIQELARLLHCTEERKGIHLRNEAYLNRLMRCYGEDAIIVLAKLPLKKLYEQAQKRYEENAVALQACPANARKKRFTLTEQRISISRECRELAKGLQRDGDNVAISGALCIRFADTAEILYAGMDEHYKHYMAPYASFYECMDWSWKKGCRWCNMGGIEGDLHGGLANFKAGFHPLIHEYVGEFDLPVNGCLYRPARWAMRKMKARNKKK